MKNYFPISIIFLLIGFSFKPISKQFVADGIKIQYQITQGRINGKYISYYPSGQKKAEGTFENNMRAGNWSVWDSTGRLRISRKYKNPFVFKRTFPKVPSDKVIKLLNIPQYSPSHNNQGVIVRYQLEERMIVWLKRIWRSIEPENNPILFENKRLENILHKNVFNGSIKAYNPETDFFKSVLNASEIDTSNLIIIKYKLKEETFYDNERLISESRILGLCPVVVNTEALDTFDLYWVYYPELRYELAKELVKSEGIPSKIESLDDLFFYRFFYGQIYKESNVYDRTITEYKTPKEIDNEALRIEFGLIESEHDMWIKMSK